MARSCEHNEDPDACEWCERAAFAKQIADLRAQLAAVEKERDEARAALKFAHEKFANGCTCPEGGPVEVDGQTVHSSACARAALAEANATVAVLVNAHRKIVTAEFGERYKHGHYEECWNNAKFVSEQAIANLPAAAKAEMERVRGLEAVAKAARYATPDARWAHDTGSWPKVRTALEALDALDEKRGNP